MQMRLPLLIGPNQCNGSPPTLQEFEFIMPLPTDESFGEPLVPSPADELFYKGQLLPLFLPSRLKMVQDLSSSHTQDKESITLPSSLKQDADPGERTSLFLYTKDPYVFPNCYKDPLMLCSSKMDNIDHGQHTLTMEKHEVNVSVGSKHGVRWKVFFRRGKKCSVEAGCCHYTRSRSTTRNATSIVGQEDVSKTCGSSFLRSGSCKGRSSLLPAKTRPASSSSSSSSMPRNPSRNSRHCREKVTYKAIKLMTATTRAHKERLVLKARDCLQKSLKVLRLARFEKKGSHYQRASLLQQHDEHMPEVPSKHRNQATHCEHKSSKGEEDDEHEMDCNKSINEGYYSDCELDTDINLATASLMNTLLYDNESSNAGFITIEPSPGYIVSYENNMQPLSSSGNINSTKVDLQNSIQGAIDHCKKSQAAGP